MARLLLAKMMLHKPNVLIFDEPMSGLDPLGRREIRELIALIRREKPHSTLFFTTHILSDVEALCSSVALLKKGHLEIFCSIADLLKRNHRQYHVQTAASSISRSLSETWKNAPAPLGFEFEVSGVERLSSLLADLRRENLEVLNIQSRQWSLEQALFSEGTSLAATLPGAGAVG